MAAVACVVTAGCDWTQHGHDAAHTGFNPSEHIITPSNVGELAVAWHSRTDVGSTHASPAVVNGIAYLSANNGTLYAWGDGSTRLPFFPVNPGATPTVENHQVYVSGGRFSTPDGFDSVLSFGLTGTRSQQASLRSPRRQRDGPKELQ